MTELLWPRSWHVERNLYVWLDHRVKPFAGDPRGLAPCGESWLRWVLGWRFSFTHMSNGLWRLTLGPLVASWPHRVPRVGSADSFLELQRFLAPPPGWRKGQQAFNALSAKNPALAERIRAGDADPFYDDARLPAFEAFVREHWPAQGRD